MLVRSTNAICKGHDTLRTARSQAKDKKAPTQLSFRVHSSHGSKRNYQTYQDKSGGKFSSFIIGIVGGGLFISGVWWIVDAYTDNRQKEESEKKEKIVILGSGWAGLSIVSEIDTKRYDITIVSPRSHFLYTPSLINATFGLISPTSLLEPVRDFFARLKAKVHCHDALCTDILPEKGIVKCKSSLDGREYEIPFDKLVVAVGGVNKTYNIKGANEHCHFLRDLQDSSAIRNKILSCVEAANLPNQKQEEIDRLLNFVVVGEGPICMLFLAGLQDLIDTDLKSKYPHLSKKMKITYISTGGPVKNTYDDKIRKYYKKELHNKLEKIEERRTHIIEAKKDSLILEKENPIKFGTCVFLTDNGPHPLVTLLQRKKPNIQRNKNALLTDEYLQVKGFSNIYAAGECSTISQRYLYDKWDELFASLDDNGDGFIDATEFKEFYPTYSRKYPQLLVVGKKAADLFHEFDINKDGKLSKEEFQEILKKVDSSITSLPTTAQSAQQQGRYLGISFNNALHEEDLRKLFHELDEDKSGYLDAKEVRKGLRKLGLPASKEEVDAFMEASDTNKDNRLDEEEFIKFALDHQMQGNTQDWKKLSLVKIKPFRYKHLGGYEYVAYENQITERGSAGKSILDGFGARWLYESIYISKLMSNTIRIRMTADYFGHVLFGRQFVRY